MRGSTPVEFSPKPVSVVLPVLGKADYTERFFQSFYKTTQTTHEIIVINNGKDKETANLLKTLREKHNNIKIIENNENAGVAASWNQGIEKSNYDFVCIVNNDIEIMIPGWLREMQKTIAEKKQIYWTSPTTCYNRDMKKMIYRAHHYEQLKYGIAGDSYVVGCCFMCPKKAFEEIGPFDEGFEVKYYEDLDFINRILQAGKRVLMTRSAIVYHAVGTTSRKTKGGHGNESYYKKKWEGSGFDILAMQPNRTKSSKHF